MFSHFVNLIRWAQDLLIYQYTREEKKTIGRLNESNAFCHGPYDWLRQNTRFLSLSLFFFFLFLILLNKQMFKLRLIVCIWLFFRSNSIHLHNLSNGMHARVTRVHQYGTRCKTKKDEMASAEHTNRIRNGFEACSLPHNKKKREKNKQVTVWLLTTRHNFKPVRFATQTN